MNSKGLNNNDKWYFSMKKSEKRTLFGIVGFFGGFLFANNLSPGNIVFAIVGGVAMAVAAMALAEL